MEKIPFNSVQQKLSPLGLGCAALSGEGGGYGFGAVTETEAEKLVQCALDLGINVFDTAPIYGFGLSEERLGRYLKNHHESFIITKGGVDWHSSKRVNMTNEPKVIERMLYESLKRLKRDCIDMYMIHWPDPKIDIRKPLEVILKAREKGDVRFVGLANTNSEDIKKCFELHPLEGFQGEHNLWTQENYSLVKKSAPESFFSGWGTFDKGILSGRVSLERKYESSDARSWAPWWNKKEVAEKLKKVETLKTLCEQSDIQLEELSLVFSLSTLSPGTSLIGSKTPQDLEKAVSIAQKTSIFPIVKRVHEEFHRIHKNQELLKLLKHLV